MWSFSKSLVNNSSFLISLFFGCTGSLVAASGGYSSFCGARVSHCSGFSCCRARALGARASVVVARGLSSCGSQALERRLSNCGAWA